MSSESNKLFTFGSYLKLFEANRSYINKTVLNYLQVIYLNSSLYYTILVSYLIYFGM